MFVAGLLGSPPMNFVEASVVEKDSKLILDAGIFQYTLPDELAKFVRE
ncbi:MAG: hypothetical protein J7L17_04535 [Thaumarchaeota archaeon]|nr:hypothetical protein [Nitrososphaerota archaeon]